MSLVEDDIYGRVVWAFSWGAPVFAFILASVLDSYGQVSLVSAEDYVYSIIYFVISPIHRITVMLLCFAFVLHWLKLKHLLPLNRFMITLVIMVFYIYAGGFFWEGQSLLNRGHGLTPVTVIGTIAFYYIICVLDDKYVFLSEYKDDVTKTILMLVVIWLIYAIMANQGFWVAMDLSDKGLGPDPNQNIWWLLMRLFSFLFMYPLLKKQDYTAPLKLSPEVF